MINKHLPTSTMEDIKFTIVQRKMIAILSDGMFHRLEELHTCLYDEEGGMDNVRRHISYIRKIIRPFGQDIICQRGENGPHYMLVRLTASPYR